MTDLSNIETDELKNELAKRTANDTRPLPIKNPDFSRLTKLTESIMEDYAKSGYSKDDDHWCYEAVMECIYGPKVWEWINKYNTGE